MTGTEKQIHVASMALGILSNTIVNLIKTIEELDAESAIITKFMLISEFLPEDEAERLKDEELNYILKETLDYILENT